MTFDGGSRGNPGPSAVAAIVCLDDGTTHSTSEYIGTATNNVAEYKALLLGLELAEAMGVTHLTIRGDSKLVVCHVNGDWTCRSKDLIPLLHQATKSLKRFHEWRLIHHRREKNFCADALVNITLDRIKRTQKAGQRLR